MNLLLNRRTENTIKDSILKVFNEELANNNVTNSNDTNYQKTALLYLDFKNRNYYNRLQWRCIESKNLHCPEHLKKGYKGLIHSLETGIDIDKYQSKGLFNRRYKDKMFYEWGIVHFHLGEEKENNSFISRTKELAFVMFHLNNAYIIAIGNHESWTDEKLVTTLHKEFPHTISQAQNNMFTHVNTVPNNGEIRKKTRKHNINTPVLMDDGSLYTTINSGFCTDGTHLSVSLNLGVLEDLVDKLVKKISENSFLLLDFKGLLTVRDKWGDRLIGLLFYQPSKYRFITVSREHVVAFHLKYPSSQYKL